MRIDKRTKKAEWRKTNGYKVRQCVVTGCKTEVTKSDRCDYHSARYYGKAAVMRPGTGGGQRKPKIDGEGWFGENPLHPRFDDGGFADKQ